MSTGVEHTNPTHGTLAGAIAVNMESGCSCSNSLRSLIVSQESAEDGEIDMSNLQKEIEDFVFRYGSVSGNATDEEIMDDLYSLRDSEDRNISRHAIMLTRRL